MVARRRTPKAGFTLIELLIVVAIIGIIAAILVPMFIDSIQRARQKRTVADIREFGIAIAEYWTDFSGAGAAGVQVAVSDWSGTATFDEIEAILVPDYAAQLPEEDGWGNQLDYRVRLLDPPRSGYALVRSPGKDDAFEGDTYTVGVFENTDYDQDIVWGDGAFFRSPASVSAGGT